MDDYLDPQDAREVVQQAKLCAHIIAAHPEIALTHLLGHACRLPECADCWDAYLDVHDHLIEQPRQSIIARFFGNVRNN